MAKTGNYTVRRKVRIVVEAVVNAHLPQFDTDEIKRHIQRAIGNNLREDEIVMAQNDVIVVTWGEIIR